jgi:FkbM family methyltransferase
MISYILKKIKKNQLKQIKKKFGTTYFSQDGEDMILNAFYETKFDYKGFYVDIGAHHPFRFSNTAFFYLKGWTGINVEPTPSLFEDFVKFRERDINLNFGISDVNSTLTFYEFDEPALNSFDEKLSKTRDAETNYNIISEKQIPVCSMAEILDKYLPENQKIDFFTIDVEGLDFKVLKSNNWNKYRPNFILVEDSLNFNASEADIIYKYLAELKYKMVGKTLRTNLYQSIV